MKSKLAIFKRVGGNVNSAWDIAHWGDHMEATTDYVRVSNYVETEFPPLAAETTVLAEISALDALADEIKKDFAGKLATIESRKANLLALTDQRETA